MIISINQHERVALPGIARMAGISIDGEEARIAVLRDDLIAVPETAAELAIAGRTWIVIGTEQAALFTTIFAHLKPQD